MDSFNKRLAALQAELKAPKSQYNSFGKYRYRSCEDILEAVKPLCVKYGMALGVTDDIIQVGERIYVRATAVLRDAESDQLHAAAGFAREPDTKKGMDDSQITGTASSYARKYALNGLLCIDDSKDADTDEHRTEVQKKSPEPAKAAAPAIPKLTCQRCKKEILERVVRGVKYTPAVIAEKSNEMYSQQMCWDCMAEVKKEIKNNG